MKDDMVKHEKNLIVKNKSNCYTTLNAQKK